VWEKPRACRSPARDGRRARRRATSYAAERWVPRTPTQEPASSAPSPCPR
jgi:hypothetical protein